MPSTDYISKLNNLFEANYSITTYQIFFETGMIKIEIMELKKSFKLLKKKFTKINFHLHLKCRPINTKIFQLKPCVQCKFCTLAKPVNLGE